MLRRITAKQLVELFAFQELEPTESLKDDFRAASIREMIYNMAVATGNRRPMKDFLLKWDAEPKPEQTWQQKKMIAYAVVAAYATRGQKVVEKP